MTRAELETRTRVLEQKHLIYLPSKNILTTVYCFEAFDALKQFHGWVYIGEFN